MTIDEFLKKLIARYSNSNEQKIEDIKNWIERENINSDRLTTLELLLQTRYSKVSFPLIKDLNDIYQNGYTSFYERKNDDIYYPEIFVKYIVHQKKQNIKDIIKNYIKYENKQINQKEMHCYERYYLYIFSDLINNYRARLENNFVSSFDNEDKTADELYILLAGETLQQEKETSTTKLNLDFRKWN